MSAIADYYLRFPDEQSSFAVAQVLDAVAITEDGPRLVRFTHRYAIDVVGEIEGAEGWHVNFRILDGSELPDSLLPYVIEPAHLARVWA